MNKVGDTNVSLTYVTGALVKLGQGAGNWLTCQTPDLSWALARPNVGEPARGRCCRS